jgi:hypothetical protein
VHPLTHDPLANLRQRPPSGDAWQGDCIERMRSMPSQSVDFVLTDPPYITRYRERGGRSVAGDDNARAAKGLGREYLASSWTALIARPLPAAC